MSESMSPSEARRAENEVVFKNHNERIKQVTKTLLDNESQHTFNLGFICECSDEDCRDKIYMSVAEFEHLRHNDRQFILKLGHQQPEIERVITGHEGYNVVEKYQQPPAPKDGTLNNTKN